jgi:uncharacterized protein YheU (UPF0270 family)
MTSSKKTLQRESSIIHLRREIKDLTGSLNEVRDLVFSQMEVKRKILLDQMKSLATMQNLETEVLHLETDFGDKERELQVRMVEMEKRMLELEKNVVAAKSSWHDSREVVAITI